MMLSLDAPIHVLPIDDLIGHEDSAECACLPECQPVVCDEYDLIGYVYVHSAWDGRE